MRFISMTSERLHPDSRVEPDSVVQVDTDDGWTLHLWRGEPADDAAATLLCIPAMMVDSRALDRPRGRGMASTLRARGFRTYLLDVRGHGASKPLASRSVDWTYDDIVLRDIPAALRALRSRHPGPLALVGHSLGGHAGAAALACCSDLSVDALVMIAANIGLRRLEPIAARWWVKRAVIEAWVTFTELYGFFPARRLRVGSADEALGYVKQFRDWARADRWTDGRGDNDYLAALATLDLDVLAICGRGDRLLCPPGCARRFARLLSGSKVRMWEIGGKECGGGQPPGHMALVTEQRCRPLWHRVADWLTTTLMG